MKKILNYVIHRKKFFDLYLILEKEFPEEKQKFEKLKEMLTYAFKNFKEDKYY